MTNETKFGVGTTEQGYRVVASARLERRPGTLQTVEHEPITDPLVFAISYEVVDPKKRRNTDAYWVSGGQVDVFDGEFKVVRPDPGIDLERLRTLAGWHLNTMTAGCAHMPAVTDAVPEGEPDPTRWMLDNVVCPVSGYKWGHRWLTRPLPEEIITLAAEFGITEPSH